MAERKIITRQLNKPAYMPLLRTLLWLSVPTIIEEVLATLL